MESFAPITKTRRRRQMNEQCSAWLSAVDGLPMVHERLRRVLVLNRRALEVIRQFDQADTLFYCDPPYLHETRVAPDVYSCEMSAAEHREFLDVICACKGKVILSGYASALYDTALAHWHRRTFDKPSNAGSGKHKERKTEVVWCNCK
jgi:DNA adenine methylase